MGQEISENSHNMMAKNLEDLLNTAGDYLYYAQKKTNAHYAMCEKAKRSNIRLGIPTTVATAVVGTTIFATISSPDQNVWVQVGAGLLSMLATVFSALQTFLRYSEIAAQHKDAATSFEAIRHDLVYFRLYYGARGQSAQEQAFERFREIQEEVAALAKRAPSIPDKVYDAVSVPAPDPVKATQ